MSFLDWLRMNMAFDICFVVFTVYYLWKLKKINKKIERIEKESKLYTDEQFRDMEITIYKCVKNPRLAKSLLKEFQK